MITKKNLNNILFNVWNEDKQKKQNNSTNLEKYTFLQWLKNKNNIIIKEEQEDN